MKANKTNRYTVLVKDKNGNNLGVVDTFRQLRFGKRLNNYGQAEFDMPLNSPKASRLIDPRKNTIEIYRSKFTDIAYLLKEDGDFLLKEDGGKIILDQSGVVAERVWAGEQAADDGVLSDNGNNWISVYSYTWFEQLFHRITEDFERYEDIDAGAAIEGLISTTQGKTDGDMGITSGTINTTFNIDIIYQNRNIGESIIEISDGGLDFEITDGKELNVSSILGEDKTDSVVLEYGYNVRNVRINRDFKNPVNQALVLGEVINEDTLQRVERTNTSLRSEYGLRQGKINQLEAAIETLFEDKGDSLIRKYGQPLIKVEFDLIGNFTPTINQFDVGDGIRLIVDDDFYNIDEEYRVFEWEMTVDSDNTETLSLVLGKFTI